MKVDTIEIGFYGDEDVGLLNVTGDNEVNVGGFMLDIQCSRKKVSIELKDKQSFLDLTIGKSHIRITTLPEGIR